jgi:predicted metalloprotease with PDZ domain
VVALDGTRCDASALVTRCEEKKPGDAVRVGFFRRDRLLELPVTLGAKPLDGVWLARAEAPTPQQRASFEAWLKAPWDEPEQPADAARR